MSEFLTMRLEDGEEVIRLRRGRTGKPQWKSSAPHAGQWGEKTHYALIPCRTRRAVNIRSKVALSCVPGIVNRSSDAEVLLLGTPEQIQTLITNGPTWCRARQSRKGQPRSAAQELASQRLVALNREST